MSKALSFQQVIMTLHQFWADQGCMLWRPYNTQVGAGTNNPATLLRVLGPEPWRVAYQEPSIRPDDGRYGENPNRMQMHTQYQVILQPDPGNPQELYLRSLEAIGINQREHDIRFVEDNWESPALGAWGLGWEVWLDGQEITQYTYFQQAGGLELDPVAVEITYGLDRITLALQHKNKVWDVEWTDGLLYGEVLLRQEIEQCMYYFDIADVEGLRDEFTFYEQEFARTLEHGAVMPAYDYVLKCSHTFNVLDTRGAIGVTERANYFRKMRDMTRQVAKAYAAQREEMGYPLKSVERWQAPALPAVAPMPAAPTKAADFLLEIGAEELPAGDVDDAIDQLQKVANTLFDDLRLSHEGVSVLATPRRLVISAKNVAPRQTDRKSIEKGPPADRAYDKDNKPTKAAEGFARSRGVNVEDLQIVEEGGGRYVAAHVREVGRSAIEVLAEALPNVIGGIKFGKTIRWNSTNVSFSRPLRWMVALFGDAVIPFAYAGVASGRVTRGLRPYGSPEESIDDVAAYFNWIQSQGIVLSREERRQRILEQILKLADEVGGHIPDDAKLLDEVTNLIEMPTALRGTFDPQSLELPRDVLITVMRKHQRYFAIEDRNGKLMPYFITVRNGDSEHLDIVADGNEHVLRARFSDAAFFYKTDREKALHDFLPRLSTLTFQEKLGSMLDKNERVAGMIEGMGKLLGTGETDVVIAQRAAHIAKADLATQMVVELTSLQGTMGKVYAGLSGYPQEVADAVFEHWLPRGADDILPQSSAGVLLALTDKLDSLVGLFGVGLAPKSSADPYGLRRAALGVIQILVDKNIDLPLRRAIDLVASAQPVSVSDDARQQVLDFIAGRLEAWMLEQGTAQTDVIQAVLAQQSGNPARAVVGVRELSEWVKRDKWENILDSFARCVRITRPVAERYEVNPASFVEPQEKALYEAYQAASGQLKESGNVDAFLSAFTPMLPAVTAFFDNVLVNAEDEKVRHNRLGLLQAIGAMQSNRADLSLLSGF